MSPRPLTNKQLLVLRTLHEHGPLTVNALSDKACEEIICADCGGTGDGDSTCAWDVAKDHGTCCRSCFGRGHAWMGYAACYQALQRLRREGLVARRWLRDRFGDEIPTHVYFALEQAAKDPLEQAFAMPAVEPARCK